MGLLARWRAWRETRREALRFEARWTVAADDGAITITDAEGEGRRIDLAALDAVLVETNDTGPWGADLWWLLFTGEGTLAAGWPQGATGELAAIDRLVALPGFDLPAMAQAMTSTRNATFVLWRRTPEPAEPCPTTF